MPGLEFRLLGPLEVAREGHPIGLGGAKQRIVLALLALHANDVVSTDRLVDALWGESPPETARTVVHGHVSALRKLLGADVLRTRPPGYRLAVDPKQIDLARFEAIRATARDLPASERAAALREVLALWRGAALDDLAREAGVVQAAAARLDEARLVVEDDLVDSELELGQHARLVAELEAGVAAEPLRERRVGQLMLALYRCGRQVDALQAYRRYRSLLSARFGLEPGPELRSLEHAILAHDSALIPAVADRAGSTAGGQDSRTPVSVVAVALTVESVTGRRIEPEVYSDVVTRWRETVRLQLERYGGRPDGGRGSRLGAAFGLPTPFEDNALRAARAAEAVHRATAALDRRLASSRDVRLRVRIGLASGRAHAGESPAIDRAAQLQETAQPGETLIDDATYRIVRAAMLAERIDGETLRLVGLADGGNTAPRKHERRLVGRGGERQRLHRRLSRAAALAGPRLFTVLGPPGIGKSRLAADLVTSLPGVTVLRGRCVPYGDGVGLLPVIEVVRSLTGIPERLDEAAARARLAGLLQDVDRSAVVTERLLELLGLSAASSTVEELSWAVSRLLEAAASRQPLLVYLDDLHWAQPALLDLVEQVLDSPLRSPVLVLVTARAAPRPRFGGRGALLLAPLDERESAELVGEILDGGVLAGPAAETLFRASGGNPLFLEELVRALRSRELLHSVAGRWQLVEGAEGVIPPTLEELLAARLSQLSTPEQRLLGCAAVIGTTFSLPALRQLGDVEIEGPLAGLAESELVHRLADEPGSFEFRHTLIRDAAYDALPLERRAALHEAHAGWLEQQGRSPAAGEQPVVLYHLDRAHRARALLNPGDGSLAGAARSLAERFANAGRAALDHGDAGGATQLLGRARELHPALPGLLVDLGRALLEIGDFAAAREAFGAAEPADTLRARLGLLDARLRTDSEIDLAAAEAELAEAIDELTARSDLAGLGEAWLTRAYLSVVRGQAAELTAALDQAYPHVRAAGLRRAESGILFLQCAACWYGPLPVDAGLQRCELIRREARESSAVEASALQALAVLEAMAGRFDAARQHVGASRAIRAELGQRLGVAATSIDAGVVELLAGRYDRAEEILRAGYDALQQLGELGHLATVASFLAEAVEAQGRLDEAHDIARTAAAASAADDVATQVSWRVTEARVLAARGEHARAEQVAADATTLAEATDFLLLRGEAWAGLGDVLAARGDRDRAERARVTAAAALTRKGLAAEPLAAWARIPGRR